MSYRKSEIKFWLSRVFMPGMCTLILFGFFSCKSTRRIEENEYLVKRNKIELNDGKFDTEELRELVRQKPNRKVLFFWSMNLRLYNLGLGKNQDKKFKTWLRKIGEEPVKRKKQPSKWRNSFFRMGTLTQVLATLSIITTNKRVLF
ncbi:MAG: hypothetical protein ACPF8V_07490 [Luteibaculum sp.]